MSDERDLARLREGTIGVYERQAALWDQARDKSLYEHVWLDRLTQGLPEGASILDLGCGAGRPIAQHLVSLGFDVTGLDASAPMLDLARRHVPNARFILGDMRRLEIDGRFDALISWDAFFHLSPDAQKITLQGMAALVKPRGRMMMTVGTSEGTALGTVGGEAVYHGSLDPKDYETRLTALGFQKVQYHAEDPRVKGRSVLFASEKT
jgi:2-polyprenyl-3-methyl-5-hydroxy-6-metoxy-1,4-benzoquinol methylase